MRLTPDEAVKSLHTYCNSNLRHPFFVCVDGSADMKKIIAALPDSFRKMRVSDYCGKDSLPDFDRLFSAVSSSSENLVILGLGENCFLTDEGHAFARLKDISVSQKIVAVCRHGEDILERLAKNDSKFTSYNWCSVQSNADYSVVKIDKELELACYEGYKELLRALEDGNTGKLYVHTGISMVNCSVVRSAYDAIKAKAPSFLVPKSALTDEQWEQYLKDSNLNDCSLKSWRNYLKMYLEGAPTPYLRLVMRLSPDFSEYTKQLLSAILTVDWNANVFRDLYEERKTLLSQFTEYEIEEFVLASKERDADRIHYLTDKTLTERRAIIEEISTRKIIPDELELLYPALTRYLHKYQFCCNNGHELTKYFDEYKRQKLLNVLKDEFRKLVDEMSEPSKRLYTDFQTRKQVLAAEKNGLKNPGLYWLDALGVEYLGFIQELAKELNLTIRISLAKALLPTLTCYNREFYDSWDGPKAEPDKQLDTLKHHGSFGLIKSGDNDQGAKYLPTYLADELLAVENAVHAINKMLMQRKAEQVFLVSDHGASRLAVINNHENKWEMASKGEHSGRCCLMNEIDEAPLAATKEERDDFYWVLANYDRFKGGRMADIEVHGGASLEETLIPIIRFELSDKSIDCHIMGESVIIESLEGNPVIPLSCNDPNATLSLVVKGTPYQAVQDESNDHKYTVLLNGMWRNGPYTAEVYNGDNRLKDISFTIEKVRRNNGKQRDGSEFFG